MVGYAMFGYAVFGYAMFGYAMFGFVNLEDSQGAIADPPRRRLRFNQCF